MRIVHFSDWHGDTYPLPSADIYFCTGDMLPNFRTFTFDVPGQGRVVWEQNMHLFGALRQPKPVGELIEKKLDKERERAFQTRYFSDMGHGYVRRLLSSPMAPVVCCRGNHDFVELAPMFAGGPVFEVGCDPKQTFLFTAREQRVKIGGVRGVLRHRSEWSDVQTEEEFSRVVEQLPTALDILVTHMPPRGIRDHDNVSGSLGSRSLREYFERRNNTSAPLKAHLFGHVHDSPGVCQKGETFFSNASRSWQVIEL